MMVIEMRKSAKERALELLEEIKDLHHRKKAMFCELEDTLYDCFESSEEEDEVENEMPEDDDEIDDDYRRMKSKYRRSGMRHMHEDDYDGMDNIRKNGMDRYRRNYRMRGGRRGQY